MVGALASRAVRLVATVPAGDDRTRAAVGGLPLATVESIDEPLPATAPLVRVRQRLFETIEPDAGQLPSDAGDGVTLFSAPGEARECVEIARAVQQQARRGIPLDRMAVLLRAPQVYAAPLQTALRRADQGMQFIAVGSELRMMSLTAQEIVRAVNPESAEKDLARY